jgi:resuscitation-promoting factor RpfB
VIERNCVDDVPFRWLAAGAAPDYRAIARFRKRHLSALGYLFVEALALYRAAGILRLGRVALDGTRVRDNASTRKVMRIRHAWMSETERVLAEEVWALLAESESIDKAEDATLGKSSRGDESPEQLRRRPTRLDKIREGKGALEAEAGQQVRQRAAPKSKALRALVGAFLLALTFAGGYAVAVHKTVTLFVDGSPMPVSTMKSRVIDVVRDNGFAVGDHDILYPDENQLVHQSDTIVLRRGRPMQVSIDGRPSKQVWTTALTVDEALKHLSMSDAAPAAASRCADCRWPAWRCRGPRRSRHPGRHLRGVDRQRRRNRPTAGGPRHRDTRPALGAAGRCQAGHRGAAGAQRRDLGRAGRL